jgi:Co/Zn/Cd efflux system component
VDSVEDKPLGTIGAEYIHSTTEMPIGLGSYEYNLSITNSNTAIQQDSKVSINSANADIESNNSSNTYNQQEENLSITNTNTEIQQDSKVSKDIQQEVCPEKLMEPTNRVHVKLDSFQTFTQAELFRKLQVAVIFCFFLFALQFMCGLLTKSFSILGDSLLTLADAFTYMIVFRALMESNSEGCYIHLIIGTFVSNVCVWVFLIFLIIEAGRNLANPRPVDTQTLLIASIVAIPGNVILVYYFYSIKEEFNIMSEWSTVTGTSLERNFHRDAILSSIGSLAFAVGAFFVALAIYIIQHYADFDTGCRVGMLDPVCTIIISFAALLKTFFMLRDAFGAIA